MRKILLLCLLVVALGHASFSQDVATKERAAAKDLAERRAALQSTDADLPVVEEANFTINITSKKNQFYGGERIEADVTLMNNGEGSPTFLLPPVEDFYKIEGIGPLREPIDRLSLPSRFSPLRGSAGSTKSHTLKHGKDLSGLIILSNLFDMTTAGTYKIKVSKRFRFPDAKKAPVTITSNTLIIEVTSNAPVSQWMRGGGA